MCVCVCRLHLESYVCVCVCRLQLEGYVYVCVCMWRLQLEGCVCVCVCVCVCMCMAARRPCVRHSTVTHLLPGDGSPPHQVEKAKTHVAEATMLSP